jgi:hypothetical protein
MSFGHGPTVLAFSACCACAASALGCREEGGGSKTANAVAFATLAGALAVGQEVARERAIRAAASGHEHDSGCPSWECYADPDMTLEEARAYALAYIDHARADEGVRLLALDYALNAFAQDGSKQLARDHRLHRHVLTDPQACPTCAETQGAPDGVDAAPARDQLQAALGLMLSEGPGGANHDLLLGTRWHRLGIGVVKPDGRMYLTMDFAP